MPWKARRPCRHPGCANLSERGKVYCEKHIVSDGRRAPDSEAAKKADRERGTAAERGYDARWRTAREAYLANHPLCVQCMREKRITAATCVDHIIPHRGDKRLFWDIGNWQSLCASCHGKKTARGE